MLIQASRDALSRLRRQDTSARRRLHLRLLYPRVDRDHQRDVDFADVR